MLLAMTLLIAVPLQIVAGSRHDCGTWLADPDVVRQICLPANDVHFTAKYVSTKHAASACAVIQKLKHWKQTSINFASFVSHGNQHQSRVIPVGFSMIVNLCLFFF